MRHSQGDLAILGAELYDPGPSFRSALRLAAAKKTQKTSSISSQEGPRKRLKVSRTEKHEADDEKKKSRGRPRLDIQDETAADVSGIFCSSLEALL
jgi:hypothetical protein